jgi:predicted GIY-YIG superfamily endonuclease
MICVYLMRSLKYPARRYTGLTAYLQRRMEQHAIGLCRPTAPYRPWELIVAILFQDRATAEDFEKYLKSGSGRAFANARLWTKA